MKEEEKEGDQEEAGSAVEAESARTPGKDVEEDAGKRDRGVSKRGKLVITGKCYKRCCDCCHHEEEEKEHCCHGCHGEHEHCCHDGCHHCHDDCHSCYYDCHLFIDQYFLMLIGFEFDFFRYLLIVFEFESVLF